MFFWSVFSLESLLDDSQLFLSFSNIVEVRCHDVANGSIHH